MSNLPFQTLLLATNICIISTHNQEYECCVSICGGRIVSTNYGHYFTIELTNNAQGAKIFDKDNNWVRLFIVNGRLTIAGSGTSSTQPITTGEDHVVEDA